MWETSAANEFGRLTQGLKDGRVKGTNTIFFIKKEEVPKERIKDVTCGSFTCDLKAKKAETHRTRLTIGGDRVHYPGDAGTPTADMTLFKILLNSIISTKGARYVMIDIKDFYLNTPMQQYKYMKLKMMDIPEDIKREYKLQEFATPEGYIYCEIRKGMYGLPQAGIIAQELLEERLAKYGYHQSKIIPGFWKYDTKPIYFTLCVDNFAIKFTTETDVTHLIEALKKDYMITVDWEATKYIGLTIKWDYKNGKVHTHKPGYLENTMTRLGHKKPDKVQNSPHPHRPTQYGAKVQYADDKDNSSPLNPAKTKHI